MWTRRRATQLYCGGVRRDSALWSNTQRLAGEEYYEIDQEKIHLEINGELTKKKKVKKKNKAIFIYL